MKTPYETGTVTTEQIARAVPIRPELMAAVAYARSMGYAVESVAPAGRGATLKIERRISRLFFAIIWHAALQLADDSKLGAWLYRHKLIRQPVIWIGADQAGRVG